MKARYWPCFSVNLDEAVGHGSASDYLLRPQPPGASMNIRYRIELSQIEREQLAGLLGGEDGLLLRRKRQEPAHFFLRAGLFGREPANLGLSSAHSINCRIASALDARRLHVATRRCDREG